MKILLIRLSSIGDIVLTSPFPELLKKHNPGCEVFFLVKKEYSNLVKSNPHIDHVIELDNNMAEVKAMLKSIPFDHIADFQNNLRSFRLTFGLKSKIVKLEKQNFSKWMLTRFRWRHIRISHITSRYARTLSGLIPDQERLGLKYYLSSENSYDVGACIPGDPFITWAIGSKQKTKIFPADRIAEVIRGLGNVSVVLLGGQEDILPGERICKLAGSRVINACGKLKFDESVFLIHKSELLVTNDTGLMHAATALNKSMIVLWGSTSPLLGMAPQLSSDKIVHVTNERLNCQPCSRIGFDVCPEGHFRCMNEIPVSKLVLEIRKLMVRV